MGQPGSKTVLTLSYKLNILLAHNPAIVLFRVYTNQLKTYVQTKTYMGMFTAILFLIAQT